MEDRRRPHQPRWSMVDHRVREGDRRSVGEEGRSGGVTVSVESRTSKNRVTGRRFFPPAWPSSALLLLPRGRPRPPTNRAPPRRPGARPASRAFRLLFVFLLVAAKPQAKAVHQTTTSTTTSTIISVRSEPITCLCHCESGRKSRERETSGTEKQRKFRSTHKRTSREFFRGLLRQPRESASSRRSCRPRKKNERAKEAPLPTTA